MVEQVVINKETPADPATQETAAETTTEEVVAEEQPSEAGQKILGKFETQEDLEKAYKALESKIGQAKEEPKEDKGLEIEETAEKTVEAAGLDMAALEKEYADNGELSEDSLVKLEKAGISRSVVGNYIDGIQALSVSIETDIKSMAGGNEGYKEMIAWAKDNLSKEEISAYNRVINNRDLDQNQYKQNVSMAVQGLLARKNNNAEPNLVRGKQSTTTDKFESMAQVTAAMSDPRYEKDPAYRKEVEQKIARSDVY